MIAGVGDSEDRGGAVGTDGGSVANGGGAVMSRGDDVTGIGGTIGSACPGARQCGTGCQRWCFEFQKVLIA